MQNYNRKHESIRSSSFILDYWQVQGPRTSATHSLVSLQIHTNMSHGILDSKDSRRNTTTNAIWEIKNNSSLLLIAVTDPVYIGVRWRLNVLVQNNLWRQTLFIPKRPFSHLNYVNIAMFYLVYEINFLLWFGFKLNITYIHQYQQSWLSWDAKQLGCKWACLQDSRFFKVEILK